MFCEYRNFVKRCFVSRSFVSRCYAKKMLYAVLRSLFRTNLEILEPNSAPALGFIEHYNLPREIKLFTFFLFQTEAQAGG